jgi:plasmid maintenance system killer protein
VSGHVNRASHILGRAFGDNAGNSPARTLRPCNCNLCVYSCNLLVYSLPMIVTVRHKGLRVYLTTGHASGLNPGWMGRLNIILSKLNAAATPQDMAEPRHRLHRLTGTTPPRYSIRLTAN